MVEELDNLYIKYIIRIDVSNIDSVVDIYDEIDNNNLKAICFRDDLPPAYKDRRTVSVFCLDDDAYIYFKLKYGDVDNCKEVGV